MAAVLITIVVVCMIIALQHQHHKIELMQRRMQQCATKAYIRTILTEYADMSQHPPEQENDITMDHLMPQTTAAS